MNPFEAWRNRLNYFNPMAQLRVTASIFTVLLYACSGPVLDDPKKFPFVGSQDVHLDIQRGAPRYISRADTILLFGSCGKNPRTLLATWNLRGTNDDQMFATDSARRITIYYKNDGLDIRRFSNSCGDYKVRFALINPHQWLQQAYIADSVSRGKLFLLLYGKTRSPPRGKVLP